MNLLHESGDFQDDLGLGAGVNHCMCFQAQNAPVAGAMSITGASYWIKD